MNNIESGSSKENAFLKKHQHYCFANRRPIDPLPLLVSTLNEIYKKYNHHTKYAFIINLKLDHQQIDLNLTPNKREIFVRKATMESVADILKQEISKKVIEEIPTLGRFQEKEDKKRQTVGGSGSAGVNQEDIRGFSHPQKSVFFPNKSQEPEKPAQ